MFLHCFFRCKISLTLFTKAWETFWTVQTHVFSKESFLSLCSVVSNYNFIVNSVAWKWWCSKPWLHLTMSIKFNVRRTNWLRIWLPALGHCMLIPEKKYCHFHTNSLTWHNGIDDILSVILKKLKNSNLPIIDG